MDSNSIMHLLDKNCKLLLLQVVTRTGLPHPYSISVYEQSMYWDDWSTQSIQKANKRDGSARQTIKSNVRGLMDLKVFHQDVQTGGSVVTISLQFLDVFSDHFKFSLFTLVQRKVQKYNNN